MNPAHRAPRRRMPVSNAMLIALLLALGDGCSGATGQPPVKTPPASASESDPGQRARPGVDSTSRRTGGDMGMEPGTGTLSGPTVPPPRESGSR